MVTFTSGSRLSANLLNDALLQNIYAMEELEENFLVGMGKTGGHWDATNLRITNCADATASTDAVCWGQITITNADKYPGAATANTLLKGDGSSYVEGETLADAGAGDAEKLVTVNAGGTGLEYDTFANYMAAWAPIHDSASNVSWTGTGIGAAPFSVQITLPSAGTWNYTVLGQALCQTTANTDAYMSVALQRQIDSGGWSTIDASYVRDDEDGTSAAYNLETNHQAHFEDQSGAVLDFRLNLIAISGCTLAPTSGQPHWVSVTAHRVKD